MEELSVSAQRELQNAMVRLLKARPFYGHFLLGFRRCRIGGSAPLGVTLENGTPVLGINPERFTSFPPGEQQALLEHGLNHILHLHMLRRKGRHSHDWDVACDLAINPFIPALPAEAPRPARYHLPEGMAAEEYYQELRRPFDAGNLDGEGLGNAARETGEHRGDGGDSEGGAESAGPIDDHRIWETAESTPLRLAETVVRNLVRDALRKSHGEIPGELKTLVEGWLAPPTVPWRQVLRQFVATAGRVGRQATWKREHRRFAHGTPGIRKRRRLSLLVGVDVSDSTDLREVREAFARELVQVARGRDSRITVLYAGSSIQRIDSFRSGAAVAEVYRGGGFTDLRPVFDYARTMQPRPAAVIYLTDGFGPAPEKMEFPTLWVLTPDGKKPADWGMELRLNPVIGER